MKKTLRLTALLLAASVLPMLPVSAATAATDCIHAGFGGIELCWLPEEGGWYDNLGTKLTDGTAPLQTALYEGVQYTVNLTEMQVTAPDGIVAWVDEQNEMIVALAPGTCQVKAVLDGQEAIVDVTVLDETALAGEWRGENGETLSIDNDLNSVFVTQQGTEQIQWFRGAFSTNENSNPYRYVKLTGTRGDTPLILYYDRLSDTLRLHVDGAAPDGIFVRGF